MKVSSFLLPLGKWIKKSWCYIISTHRKASVCLECYLLWQLVVMNEFPNPLTEMFQQALADFPVV